MAKRRISILDLAELPPGSQAIIAGALAAQLENLAVVSHGSTTSPGAIIHTGVVKPLTDLGFPALRGWDVEVPGPNTGFHLSSRSSRRRPGYGGTYREPCLTGPIPRLIRGPIMGSSSVVEAVARGRERAGMGT